MYGSRYATARFIARALLTTCGRNIFPAPKRSPTTCIPPIRGPSITSSGRSARRRASSVSSSMKSTMPCTSAGCRRFSTGPERVLKPLLARRLAPGEVDLPLRSLTAHAARVLDQPLGRVVAPVEDDVLNEFEQLRLDVLVHDELARVDDAHVEAGADRVVEEGRVHRLAHGVVAAEGEAEVGDPTARPRARAALLDQWQRLEKRLREAAMLVDAGRDGEDVRIEDQILG